MRKPQNKVMATPLKLYEWLGALLVLGIAGITAVDVAGRYFFSKPLFGAYDMIEAAMALCTFWFLPYLSRRNEHVQVSMLDNLRPAWLNSLRITLVDVISAVGSSLIAWRLFHAAADFHTTNEASMVIGLPKAPIVVACGVIAGLMALVHILKTFRLLRQEEIA